MTLAPCATCRRPIRDALCPFCAGRRSSSQHGTRPTPSRLVAAHAALVAAGLVIDGCGTGSAVPFYGAACLADCVDAAEDDSSEPALPDVGPDAPADAAPEAATDADADARDAASNAD